ncbi:hypothetical protein JB92DRAFT_2625940, partial [Gautieria morchelliformis]
AAKTRKDDEAKGIPTTLPWSANKNAKIWELITELSKPENFKVLFRKKDQKENTSGESKNAVFTRIGQRIWPGYALINKKTVAQHTKNKYDGLKDTYREHAKKLLQTGGGIGAETDGPDAQLGFYIPLGGPDAATCSKAQNLWQQITEDFEIFPSLHAI